MTAVLLHLLEYKLFLKWEHPTPPPDLLLHKRSHLLTQEKASKTVFSVSEVPSFPYLLTIPSLVLGKTPHF